MNPEDEHVLPFITELKTKLSQPAMGMAGSPSYPSLVEALKRGTTAAGGSTGTLAAIKPALGDDTPFELRALEVCLDHVRPSLAFPSALLLFQRLPPACCSPLPRRAAAAHAPAAPKFPVALSVCSTAAALSLPLPSHILTRRPPLLAQTHRSAPTWTGCAPTWRRRRTRRWMR